MQLKYYSSVKKHSTLRFLFHLDIPELRDHKQIALTVEGLLVLLHDGDHVRLFNPLTRHLLVTLLPPEGGLWCIIYYVSGYTASGSAVVLLQRIPLVLYGQARRRPLDVTILPS